LIYNIIIIVRIFFGKSFTSFQCKQTTWVNYLNGLIIYKLNFWCDKNWTTARMTCNSIHTYIYILYVQCSMQYDKGLYYDHYCFRLDNSFKHGGFGENIYWLASLCSFIITEKSFITYNVAIYIWTIIHHNIWHD
jgi:hypothetical protein